MKLPNRTFNKKLKAQHGRCYYCGFDLIESGKIEIDHIIPFSKSLDGTKANLCLACRHCNRLKSDFLVDDFKLVVSERFPEKLIRGMFYFEFIRI